MKKFFTLLFCVAGMAVAANAQDVTPVRQCIDALLAQDHNTRGIVAPTMDPNQDGILNVADIAFLIDQHLKQNNVQKAPAKDIDVKALINEVLVSDGDPNVDDVTDAINKKMNKKE